MTNQKCVFLAETCAERYKELISLWKTLTAGEADRLKRIPEHKIHLKLWGLRDIKEKYKLSWHELRELVDIVKNHTKGEA